MKAISTSTKAIAFFLITAVTVGLDQWTKVLAAESLKGRPGYSFLGNMLRLEYAENSGAFLSLGAALDQQTRTLLFVLGVMAIIAFCLVWLLRSARGWLAVSALSLVIAGGIGNLIDRVERGTVIDFIYMGIGNTIFHTGVFNVADIAISAGVLILLLDQYLVDRAAKVKA